MIKKVRFFTEPSVPFKHSEKLPSRTVFQNVVKLAIVLESPMNVDDKRVVAVGLSYKHRTRIYF